MSYAELITLARELKEALENNEHVVLLNQLDQQLNQNQTLLTLSESYQRAQINYQAMWESYGDESPHLLRARAELHQVKIQVDSHPLVRDYLKTYGQVREIYQSIQQKIFTPFKSHPPGC
ncbi:MAG: hypothetical protein RIS53_771 [Bacillota bacterium]|jgi:cell fate (sporulation/competence/biofilm development) regulator YmcA (YheA/YmcA/DUF963 family)